MNLTQKYYPQYLQNNYQAWDNNNKNTNGNNTNNDKHKNSDNNNNDNNKNRDTGTNKKRTKKLTKREQKEQEEREREKLIHSIGSGKFGRYTCRLWAWNKWPTVNSYFYMVVSSKHAFTKWHVDFGGSKVWYNVTVGKKIFFIIKTTMRVFVWFIEYSSDFETNLDFPEWVKEKKSVELTIYAIVVEAPNMIELPGLTLHSVYTYLPSIANGSNFITNGSFSTAILGYVTEIVTQTDPKYTIEHMTNVMYLWLCDKLHKKNEVFNNNDMINTATTIYWFIYLNKLNKLRNISKVLFESTKMNIWQLCSYLLQKFAVNTVFVRIIQRLQATHFLDIRDKLSLDIDVLNVYDPWI